MNSCSKQSLILLHTIFIRPFKSNLMTIGRLNRTQSDFLRSLEILQTRLILPENGIKSHEDNSRSPENRFESPKQPEHVYSESPS